MSGLREREREGECVQIRRGGERGGRREAAYRRRMKEIMMGNKIRMMMRERKEIR